MHPRGRRRSELYFIEHHTFARGFDGSRHSDAPSFTQHEIDARKAGRRADGEKNHAVCSSSFVLEHAE
jgi:hypothetical protein